MTDNNNNPCIKVETVTTKRVVAGSLRSPGWSGCIKVRPYEEHKGVRIDIDNQVLSKNDLMWLSARLVEISEAL